jgi:hypothetical protein
LSAWQPRRRFNRLVSRRLFIFGKKRQGLFEVSYLCTDALFRRYAMEHPHQPVTNFQAYVSSILFVFMRLLQEEDSNHQTEEHDDGAHQVRKKIWKPGEERARQEKCRIFPDGFCQSPSKTGANYRAISKAQVSHRGFRSALESFESQPTYPRHQTNGIIEYARAIHDVSPTAFNYQNYNVRRCREKLWDTWGLG